jgi:uncharacterized protein YecT (DUF1311 family)
MGGVPIATAGKASSRADAEALAELASASHIPKNELEELVADCSASQQSMNFCSWRDLIKAKQKLQKVLAEKGRQLPTCEQALNNKVAAWEKSRDAKCAESASGEWGDGSVRPTAQAVCATQQTERMAARISSINTCSAVSRF